MTDEEVIEFIWKMPETCALDIIELEEPCSLQEIATLLGGITRERVRQIVNKGKKQWKNAILASSCSNSGCFVWSTILDWAS